MQSPPANKRRKKKSTKTLQPPTGTTGLTEKETEAPDSPEIDPESNAPASPVAILSPISMLVEKLIQRMGAPKTPNPSNSNTVTDSTAKRKLEFAESAMTQQILRQIPKFKGTAEENVQEWTNQVQSLLGPASFSDVQKRALLIGRLGEGPLNVVNAQGATYATALTALLGAYKITTDPARILAEFRELQRLDGERPAAFVNRINAQATFSNKLAQEEVVNKFLVMEQLKTALSSEQRILVHHSKVATPADLIEWMENDEAVRPTTTRLPRPIKAKEDIVLVANETTEAETESIQTDDPDLAMIIEEYKKKKLAGTGPATTGKPDNNSSKVDGLERRLLETQKDQLDQRAQQRRDLCMLAEKMEQHHADLKANTKCFNCNKNGHFQAECSEPCRHCDGDHASASCTRKKRPRPAPRDNQRERDNHRPTRDTHRERDICKYADRCRSKNTCRFYHPRGNSDQRRERPSNDRRPPAPSDGICNQWNSRSGCPRREACTYKHVPRKVDRAPQFDEPIKE